MGGGIEFSGAQFAGRGIGGKRERWKGDFLFTTRDCSTVSVCTSVHAWRDLCTARSAMRAEIKKSPCRISSFSPYLPYLRIGNHPFPGRGFGELCITIGHVPVCLSVGSFVRSFVSLFIVVVVIGRRRYGIANRTITSFITHSSPS